MTDHAIVVGVARYPGLAVRGVSADLAGPDNDAQAVYDWLVTDGGLDPARVTLIRTAERPFDPADPQPAAERIVRALAGLEAATRETPGGRLYLYLSGHGFAPTIEEGALFTADATHQRPVHVYAHAWLRWFRRAGRFREFVLLMDCCMTARVTVPVAEVDLVAEIAAGTPGPAFVGLAAQTREALEYQGSDGVVRGSFTAALLAGLRGGAGDERGRITGTSLKSFLHNALPEFLPPTARASAAIDLYPFVRADDGIVFGRLVAPPTFPVTLRAPAAAAGGSLTVYSGRPYTSIVTGPLGQGPQWTGELPRGLYVAEVASAGIRHGFQVTGAGPVEVELTATGAPVAPLVHNGQTRFALEVLADNPAAAITVVDHRFEVVFTETGDLRVRDQPGVYKVRVELGRDVGSVREEILLLDRDLVGHRTVAPAAVPVAAAGAPRPFGLDAASAWADRPAGSGVIGLRGDVAGLELCDPDGRPVPVRTDADGWRYAVLPPGVHLLRQSVAGTVFEGSVVCSADWLTDVTVRAAGSRIVDVSVFMRPADGGPAFMRPADGAPAAAGQDATIEAARLALAQGRDLFREGHGATARTLLLTRYLDPVATIIGAHLVLRAGGPETGVLLDAAVRRLRGFVGKTHPDVEALATRSTDPGLRPVGPVGAPPMLRAGWELLADAVPGVVPGALRERLAAATTVAGYLVWPIRSGDPATR